jgi:phage tail-like protein
MSADQKSQPRLLEYLPAIYQEEREPSVLKPLLETFEEILFGRSGAHREYWGLRQFIRHLPNLFNPDETYDEFLPWLSQWVALSLRADWDKKKQREFIGYAIPLYHCRGTKRNLEEILRLFSGGTPEVVEPEPVTLQVGIRSTVGVDTWLGGERPHFFEVTIKYLRPTTDDREKVRLIETAHYLIERNKPAHTYYELKTIFPEATTQSELGSKLATQLPHQPYVQES